MGMQNGIPGMTFASATIQMDSREQRKVNQYIQARGLTMCDVKCGCHDGCRGRHDRDEGAKHQGKDTFVPVVKSVKAKLEGDCKILLEPLAIPGNIIQHSLSPKAHAINPVHPCQ